MPATAPAQILALRRLIPVRAGWSKDPRCRILAGCYETEQGREVYVCEQIGAIVGWNYCEWEGAEPVAVKLYMRVQL